MSTSPHGTRTRYVAGCRCPVCRAANVRDYHARLARARELAEDYPAGPPVPLERAWTTPSGEVRSRTYRGCPGVLGEPCVGPSILRKDAAGRVCVPCALRLLSAELAAEDPLVDSGPAREHLIELSTLAVGRRAVATASDVAESVLIEIRAGRRASIRASTARRILDVDAGARADAATVPAGPTLLRIRKLLALGFRKGEIALALGASRGALQLRGPRVLLRTEHRVRRLLARTQEQDKDRRRALQRLLSELPAASRPGVEAAVLDLSPVRGLETLTAIRLAWVQHRVAMADPDTLCPRCGYGHGPGERRENLKAPDTPRTFPFAHREWPCVYPDDPLGRARFAADLDALRKR